MLTQNQLDLVEKYLEVDPALVALKSGDAALAQVVAALQKAKIKNVSYYNARCELTTVMVEQSTSEVVAYSRRFFGGELAIDLTCGMGVDSFALSKVYKKVISIEIDSDKVDLIRENFKKLGVNNVEVACDSAEEFLEKFNGVADIIFCDPSRRTVGGKRLYGLSDCAPNIVELMPHMRSKSKQVMVKLSPIFDVDELFKIFQECDVEVVSLNNECKEVVLHIGDCTHGKIINTVIRAGKVERFEFNRVKIKASQSLANPRFIYQIDVAFYKSRTVENYLSEYYSGAVVCFNGYVFSENRLDGFVGREWVISEIIPYQPKKLKKLLKERSITKATILQKNFVVSNDLICKQLGIKEGGAQELIFTTLYNKPVVIIV